MKINPITVKTLQDDLDVLKQLEEAVNNSVNYQIGEYIKSDTADLTYVLQGNGFYEIRETKLAQFRFKRFPGSFIGLPSNLEVGMTLKVPKVPINMYYDLIHWFRQVFNHETETGQKFGSEAYCRIYFNPETKQFYFYVPKQEVSGGIAVWEDDDDNTMWRLAEEHVLVMQVHSHHNMTGHFSSVDDKDHQDLDGIHMVIGNIFDSNPTFQLRYSLGEQKIDVDFDTMWNVYPDYEYSDEVFGNWKDKVKLKSYKKAIQGFVSNKPNYSQFNFPYKSTRATEFNDELLFPDVKVTEDDIDQGTLFSPSEEKQYLDNWYGN